MITRIRIEGTGPTDVKLERDLKDAIDYAMHLAPGKWELDAREDYAKDGMEIFSAKTGWWGFIVAKRVDV